SSKGFATIGKNDGTVNIDSPEITGRSYAVYGNSISFYDGVLRGGVKAYQDGSITAIPDAYSYHIEESTDYKENCWLVAAPNYLQVGDEQYNSLSLAYDAITGDSGTIKVIADTTVEAVLPNSPENKTITFDLNGHQLTYTQILFNNGTMIITDSDPDKSGKLLHPDSNSATIVNHGHLTLESGYISSGRQAVYNHPGATFVMNGGTLDSTSYGIYANGENNNRVSVTINGGTVIGDNYGIYSNNYSSVSLLGGTIRSKKTGIYSNGANNFLIDGGNIIIENSDDTGNHAYGIYGGTTTTTTFNSGNITINRSSTYYSYSSGTRAYGISQGAITMNGGSITITGATKDACYGLFSTTSGKTTTITGGSISVTNSSNVNYSEAYGVYQNSSSATLGIAGASISVSSPSKSYGVYYRIPSTTSSISDSIISATSSSTASDRNAYGVYLSSSSSDNGNVKFTGVDISASSTNNLGIGIYATSAARATMLSGTVSGSTYGIYADDESSKGFATIGKNDGTVNIDSPEITGRSYAVYGNSISFYDGVLRGGVKA
ncbi:MAG: hypothetical protein J5621_03450, partial [Paludibacteraceae bacterium]|nr:hypothetical protein [Paludibacteraceae bacterium]